jgi:cyclic beta-1,2-glucan synthetase
VSDVYQDVFYEGSFIGKGIYDVDTFERVLATACPTTRSSATTCSRLLPARRLLLSDAQLYEAYPARYSDDVSRRHRWIRGDWQLAGWLRARAGRRRQARSRTRCRPLSRWKLFDNLRRSWWRRLLTAMLLLCWSLLPSPGSGAPPCCPCSSCPPA